MKKLVALFLSLALLLGAIPFAMAEETLPGIEKYDPEITLHVARIAVNEQFLPGESIDNNAWIQAYKDYLGINIVYDWVVPNDQYDSKLAVSIAAGDLPDLFQVNKQNFAMCVENGLLADQTEAFNTQRSDLVKELMTGYDLSFESATIDGQLLAFPNLNEDPSAMAAYTFIRRDWLENLGLEVPTTQQELLEVARAFTHNDPDGNGVDDTYGIAAYKDLWGVTNTLEGFFNSYHAYPYIWIQDGQGGLTYGSVQPEMKTALADLQALYAEGVLDKEFGIKSSDKVDEDVESGKVGIVYGRWWTPINAMGRCYMADQNADWITIMPVSNDDQAVSLQSQAMSPTSYMVISKDCEYPDAYVRMVNLFYQLKYADEIDYKKYSVDTENGITPHGYAIGTPWPYWNSRYDDLLKVYDGTMSPDELNDECRTYYDNVMAYKPGEPCSSVKVVAQYKMYGPDPDTSYAIRYNLIRDNRFVNDEFVTFNTETMTEKGATLKKMENEALVKVIMGDMSVDEYDTFIENWYKLGGQDITDELNAWYSTTK